MARTVNANLLITIATRVLFFEDKISFIGLAPDGKKVDLS
jgi:hypothetical protein